MTEPGLFEAIFSTRSMRRLKPDPVPDEVIYKILDAGIRAPSGGNNQHWRFVVVKDPQVKQQVQQIYQKGWSEVQAMYRNRSAPAHMEEGKFRPDLFYRLNVITVKLPPLRERTEDAVRQFNAYVATFRLLLERQLAEVDGLQAAARTIAPTRPPASSEIEVGAVETH